VYLENNFQTFFSHEPAEDQLLWFLGDLLHYSRLRDSIESYDINCKQNQTEYSYSVSTFVVNTLQQLL